MNENEGRRPATVRTNDSPPPKETDWVAVYEEQQSGGDQPPPGGFLNNQLAKIGCGCALPALFLLGTCSSLATRTEYGSGSPEEMLGQLTGTVIAGILLVWSPIFLFWLRDQSKWLIGASFAIFAGIFVLVGLGKIGSGHSALREDAAALSDLKFDAEGNPILPPGMSAKGPMSKLLVDMATEQAAIRNGFDAELVKLGIPDMMFANRVTRNPSLVQNCARIPALGNTIESYRKRNVALINSGPERIDALDVTYFAKAEMKRAVLARHDSNLRMINAQWDLQARALNPIHRTCLLLSKRNWKAQGALFAFYNQADIQTFDTAMREIDRVNAELAALTKERMQDVRAGQERLKEQIKP